MAAMVLRYVLTMAMLPELHWFGHTIPIAFHFVLASYMLTLGLPVHRIKGTVTIAAKH